jgi:ketopantoate hydroxymethyltransferase (EC 2.1.2.11)
LAASEWWARRKEQKKKILEDAKALRDAGAFAIVLEFVPASLGQGGD